MIKTQQVRRFNGLNNVSDPARLGLGWLAKADNVNITDSGAIERRDGFALALAGSMTGAFATQDGAHLYVVDGGDLKEVLPDMTTRTLVSGLAASAMQWVEVNNQVFYSDGISTGVINRNGEVAAWEWPVPATPHLWATEGDLPAGMYRVLFTFLLPDGRETGAGEAAMISVRDAQAIQITNIPLTAGLRTQVYIAPADSTVFQLAFEANGPSASWNSSPDALGIELANQSMSPVPAGASSLALWRGRIYAAQYIRAENVSVVWFSEPLGFHLFDLAKNYFAVPGKVTMLAAHDGALIIGTDTEILAYDGEGIKQLAPYGAVAGASQVVDEDTGNILFWTTRGLCSALPFVNLTARQVSVKPGVQAGAAIIREDGAKRYVVSLVKGGTAFNPRT